MTDSKTIVDIPLSELGILENLSHRTVTLCSDTGLTTLSKIIKSRMENSGFLFLRKCGKKSNTELIQVCDKYINYDILESIYDFESDYQDTTIVNPLLIDEFLYQLKLDSPNFELVKMNIVGYDYIPIFKIINLLIDSDFVFQSKIKTKLFKETLNFYQTPNEYTLEGFGKQFGLTRERIRQIRLSILEKSNFYFKQTTLSEYHKLFLRYIDSVEQPYIFISDEITKEINNKEGTNFSKVFITYLLSIIFYKYFTRVGELKYVFEKDISKKSNHFNHLFLVNEKITVQFKFDRFTKHIESLIMTRPKGKIQFFYDDLIKKFKTSKIKDYQTLNEIINLIMIKSFSSTFDFVPNGFRFHQNVKPTFKSYIIEILKNSNKPLHYSEIYHHLVNQGHTVSELTIHNLLVTKSNFGLKGQGIYDLRSKGGFFGSIGDVTKKILLEKGREIEYLYLKRLLMKELVVSEDSINTILFNYDLKNRFIKRSGRVYLRKWLGQGQLSINFNSTDNENI